jgi:hypothetical protein
MLQLYIWQSQLHALFYNQIKGLFGALLFGMLTALDIIMKDFNK